MEGMRRIDEMARLADSLPLSMVLAVDFPRLLAQLAEMPDELNGVLRLFDGVRTVRQVIAGSPIADLSTLAAVQKLMSDGVLVRGTPAVPRQKPSLQQWLGATPPPPDSAPPVADEDLPLAEVLMTPPEGHAAAVERAAGPPTKWAASSGPAPGDADERGARVTPIRSRVSGDSAASPATPSPSPGSSASAE